MKHAFKPAVTVAAIIKQDGRYLLVEEQTKDGLRYNQPAGHLDAGESLLSAVVRETFEETAYAFTPSGLLGIYLCKTESSFDDSQASYLRFAFTGTLGARTEPAVLDEGIVRALWLTYEEVAQLASRHRSPLVLECVRDAENGRAPMSLDLLTTHPSALYEPAHS